MSDIQINKYGGTCRKSCPWWCMHDSLIVVASECTHHRCIETKMKTRAFFEANALSRLHEEMSRMRLCQAWDLKVELQDNAEGNHHIRECRTAAQVIESDVKFRDGYLDGFWDTIGGFDNLSDVR